MITKTIDNHFLLHRFTRHLIMIDGDCLCLHFFPYVERQTEIQSQQVLEPLLLLLSIFYPVSIFGNPLSDDAPNCPIQYY